MIIYLHKFNMDNNSKLLCIYILIKNIFTRKIYLKTLEKYIYRNSW